MEKAFLLVITILIPGQRTDMPVMVYNPPAEDCREMGADLVKTTQKDLLAKGVTNGSVWYRCEEVTGLPLMQTRK